MKLYEQIEQQELYEMRGGESATLNELAVRCNVSVQAIKNTIRFRHGIDFTQAEQVDTLIAAFVHYSETSNALQGAHTIGSYQQVAEWHQAAAENVVEALKAIIEGCDGTITS